MEMTGKTLGKKEEKEKRAHTPSPKWEQDEAKIR